MAAGGSGLAKAGRVMRNGVEDAAAPAGSVAARLAAMRAGGGGGGGGGE